jgi:hypothetical protein
MPPIRVQLAAIALALYCHDAAMAQAIEPLQPNAAQLWEYERKLDAFVQDAITKSRDHFVCAGIGVLDMGAAADGPLFYFKESPREPISTCGGACMLPRTERQKFMCERLCPPPEWRTNGCDEKERAFYLERRVTAIRARDIAASLSMCDNPRVRCEMTGRFENGQWIFDIRYLTFGDEDMEAWVKRLGVSRVVLGSKGQPISTRNLDGVELR